MSSVIARPASLRGNHVRLIGRLIVAGVFVSWGTGVAVYQLGFKPKQKRALDYLNNVDSYGILKEMCAKNLLQSCPESIKQRLAEAGK